jgi:putative phosphoesterase
MRIGVISDTHGLVRDEAVAALRGSDLILHAGDVGSIDVLEALAAIAPIQAIRGNVDRDDWANDLPETRTVDVAGQHIHLLHNVAELDIDPVAEGCHAVIFGHSHKPMIENRSGVLYLNPGSAGPRRFRLPICIARIEIGQNGMVPEIVELDGETGHYHRRLV